MRIIIIYLCSMLLSSCDLYHGIIYIGGSLLSEKFSYRSYKEYSSEDNIHPLDRQFIDDSLIEYLFRNSCSIYKNQTGEDIASPVIPLEIILEEKFSYFDYEHYAKVLKLYRDEYSFQKRCDVIKECFVKQAIPYVIRGEFPYAKAYQHATLGELDKVLKEDSRLRSALHNMGRGIVACHDEENEKTRTGYPNRAPLPPWFYTDGLPLE
jgi:hypothetical protein